MATNTLFRRVSVDTSNDAEMARRMQEEENAMARTNHSTSFNTRQHVSRNRTSRENNSGNDSVILLDSSSDDSPDIRSRTTRRASSSRRGVANNTSKDEEIARKLQAEFDQETIRRSSEAAAINRPTLPRTNRNRTPVTLNRASSSLNRHSGMPFVFPERLAADPRPFVAPRPATTREPRSFYNDWIIDDLMNTVATETSPYRLDLPRGAPVPRSTTQQQTRPHDVLSRAIRYAHHPDMLPEGNRDDIFSRRFNNLYNSHLMPFSRMNRGETFGGLFDTNLNDYETLLRLDDINTVSRGLSKNELAELPTFTFKEGAGDDTTCSVCIDDFKPKDEITALACSHKFHKDCIQTWLKEKRKCPLCQKDALTGE